MSSKIATIILGIACLDGSGCVAPKQVADGRHAGLESFPFARTKDGLGWQPMEFDVVARAKEHAKARGVPFDFTGALEHLRVVTSGNGYRLIIRVTFYHLPGQEYLEVDMDTSGSLLGYRVALAVD